MLAGGLPVCAWEGCDALPDCAGGLLCACDGVDDAAGAADWLVFEVGGDWFCAELAGWSFAEPDD